MTPAGALQKTIAALGRSAGPPWGKDQKDAALAAMVALPRAAAVERSRMPRPIGVTLIAIALLGFSLWTLSHAVMHAGGHRTRAFSSPRGS